MESSLLTKEVNKKNLDSSRGSNALVIRGRCIDANQLKGENHTVNHGAETIKMSSATIVRAIFLGPFS